MGHAGACWLANAWVPSVAGGGDTRMVDRVVIDHTENSLKALRVKHRSRDGLDAGPEETQPKRP